MRSLVGQLRSLLFIQWLQKVINEDDQTQVSSGTRQVTKRNMIQGVVGTAGAHGSRKTTYSNIKTFTLGEGFGSGVPCVI